MLRRFRLVRYVDPVGISGTGIVAEGVKLPDGRMILVWRTPLIQGVEQNSIGIYQNEEHLQSIHCHGTHSQLEWIDL